MNRQEDTKRDKKLQEETRTYKRQETRGKGKRQKTIDKRQETKDKGQGTMEKGHETRDKRHVTRDKMRQEDKSMFKRLT